MSEGALKLVARELDAYAREHTTAPAPHLVALAHALLPGPSEHDAHPAGLVGT